MVKFRLRRMGKKGRPFYRVIVADSRSPRNGKFIKEVGYMDPFAEVVKLDKELIFAWLDKGAKPSETVRSLFKQEHILSEYHKLKNTKSKG